MFDTLEPHKSPEEQYLALRQQKQISTTWGLSENIALIEAGARARKSCRNRPEGAFCHNGITYHWTAGRG